MTDEPTQLLRRSLASMTPQQIVEASRQGRLDAIRRGDPGDVDHHAERPEQLSREDLAGMSPAEIQKARRDGRLDDLARGSGGTYE